VPVIKVRRAATGSALSVLADEEEALSRWSRRPEDGISYAA